MNHLTKVSAELEIAYLGPVGLSSEEAEKLPWVDPNWQLLIDKLMTLDGVKSATVTPKDPDDTSAGLFVVAVVVNAREYVGERAWAIQRDWAKEVGNKFSGVNAVASMYSDEGAGFDDHLIELMETANFFGEEWYVDSASMQRIEAA